MRIAFYAPLKAPDHPVPSGDREMARLLLKALRGAGHAVEVVSTLRSFLPQPDPIRQNEVSAEGVREVDRIAASWSGRGDTPDLWLTYHNHYKAPDLLGPSLAQEFDLPFVMIEASHAPRRVATWTTWSDAADAATRAADVHVCFTERDGAGLEALLGTAAPLLTLAPFIDTEGWPDPASHESRHPVRIVTVAMMREGDKLASYRLLGASLARLQALPWTLTIIGDGPARRDVEAAFDPALRDRIRWRGLLRGDEVRTELSAHDLYAWPGFGEAFGLGYLEAQAMGLPVIALATAGVPSVVRSGETGLLVSDPTADAYAAALAVLITDREERVRLGANGSAFVRRTRTMDGARLALDQALQMAAARAAGGRASRLRKPLADRAAL